MDNLKIVNTTKIYIVAPSNVATGGPELLHQLGYHLKNDCKLDAYMYYLPYNIKNPIHSNYVKYNVPYLNKIKDQPENIIIVPELYNNVIMIEKFHNIQKIIWWLSVDFFYLTKYEKEKYFNNFLYKVKNYVAKKFNIMDRTDMPNVIMEYYKDFNLKKEKSITEADLHLVQSKYADDHLQSYDLSNIKYLSDYLNDEFLSIETIIQKKEDIVAYNPNKGARFTQNIISQATHIKFVPIEHMTRQEVIELLQKAKVYIDFGNHPGKDRIPREAAILKCCVITGRRGSATFTEDVGISDEFKFDDLNKNIPFIIQKIDNIFLYFPNEQLKFVSYIENIKNEKQLFVDECKDIFHI